MTAELLEFRARRIVEEGIGSGDLSVLDGYVAPDVVEHQRGNNPGTDGAKEVASTLHRWMTGFGLRVQSVVVDGNTVWVRNRARGSTGALSWAMRPPAARWISRCSMSCASRTAAWSSTGASPTDSG